MSIGSNCEQIGQPKNKSRKALFFCVAEHDENHRFGIEVARRFIGRAAEMKGARWL